MPIAFALKNTAKRLTPPILWDSARSVAKVLRAKVHRPPDPQERDASYYDRKYLTSGEACQHYSASDYYFLWSVVVDRLTRAGVRSVLDIGCGPGQFAALLRDKGLRRYCGLDFSEQCIQIARSVCPEFEFVTANAVETDLFETFDYEAVVCTEFLEHLEEDIRILQRIRAGARVYGTVPNFRCLSHVRYFSSRKQVHERYGKMFRDFRVDVLLCNYRRGTAFYLFEGVKT